LQKKSKSFPNADVALTPTNTFHVGFWFNDPNDANENGCAFDVTHPTPFNGEHKAGPGAMISVPDAADQPWAALYQSKQQWDLQSVKLSTTRRTKFRLAALPSVRITITPQSCYSSGPC